MLFIFMPQEVLSSLRKKQLFSIQTATVEMSRTLISSECETLPLITMNSLCKVGQRLGMLLTREISSVISENASEGTWWSHLKDTLWTLQPRLGPWRNAANTGSPLTQRSSRCSIKYLQIVQQAQQDDSELANTCWLQNLFFKNQLLKFVCRNAFNKFDRPQEIQRRYFDEKREENPQGSFEETTAYRAKINKKNQPLVLVYGEGSAVITHKEIELLLSRSVLKTGFFCIHCLGLPSHLPSLFLGSVILFKEWIIPVSMLTHM